MNSAGSGTDGVRQELQAQTNQTDMVDEFLQDNQKYLKDDDSELPSDSDENDEEGDESSV
jgi:hypothetical protein